MTRVRLEAPEALDLVDADEVAELIASTKRELDGLERHARDAVAAATAAESTAAAVQVDAAATTWTIVRLQRFLDGLREEAADDARTMVEVARYHAQVRVDDARQSATRSEPFQAPIVMERVVPDPSPVAPVVTAV